ncbi:MAG: hypothetical protein DMG32_11620 [Acidobacteria bacterium]|nr:MAG: hypothetical protein DMG32_11620 [Acidobacteriota bacterium]
MRKWVGLLAVIFILGPAFLVPAKAQKRRSLPPRLLTAKLVYFENQTGFAAVGGDALRELERWGRFQLVGSRDQAELLFVLSSKVESEALANPTEDRRFGPDLSFHFRYRPANAYLTVDDAVTGERLWSGSHAWGGLLTGFNSAGRRLVHRLRKQVER